MTREELLAKILNDYKSCYDIELYEDPDDPLKAAADYHEHQAGFMLIRKAEMWSADRHEYSFLYSMSHLDKALFEECMARTRELGEAKVQPEKGHMCSNVVAIFLCDSADEEALKALKRYRYRKDFSFTLRGWMEVHAGAAVLDRDLAVSNAAGRHITAFLTMVMHPEKRKRKRKNLLAAMLD